METEANGRPALQDVSNAKLTIASLLTELMQTGHVNVTSRRGGDCDADDLLECIVDGGELDLTFSSAADAEALAKMKRLLKLQQRGILTVVKLLHHLLNTAKGVLDRAVQQHTDQDQEALKPCGIRLTRGIAVSSAAENSVNGSRFS